MPREVPPQLTKDSEGRDTVGHWHKVFDSNTNFYYYWHDKTLESLWEEPEEFKEARKAFEKHQQQQPQHHAHFQRTHRHQQPQLHNQIQRTNEGFENIREVSRTKKTLPKGWSRQVDPKSGNVYYWNEYTEEPSWTKPTEDVKLPVNWTEQFDVKRTRRYFWNQVKNQSTWTFPAS